MSTQPNKTEEEVELGSLFIIIGKGFSKFFNFIGSIFKGIFHFFIQILLFFKEHIIKFVIAITLGAIVGFIISKDDVEKFESKLIVQPNFNSVKQLYSNIEYYNQLILHKDSITLSNKFNLPFNKVASLKGFSVKPIINSKDVIEAYDEIVQQIDTFSIKKYTFLDFTKSFTKFDYKLFEVIVKSTNSQIFTKLTDVIINDVSENEFLKLLKNASEKNYKRIDSIFLSNLARVNNLSEAYQKALIDDAKIISQGNSLSTASRDGKIREIELFNVSKRFVDFLTENNEEFANNSKIINVVSNFQSVGKISGGIFSNAILKYGFVAFILMFVFLLLKKLNKYLNEYKK
ncbi:hypothetical protein OD91_1483 [Lutibacter sp. Hel_I_33_5]|uniref:hypothetical protein n=1 Tax=Lutibacter sp. Hel_I_33_5 TaxID=1566289 RepID=UPI0011AAA0F6|nr:hypothetical protein [Lutibacter sp. Hel_I_33_5]TVZ56203.1 hypothetical protein OD91_1483 [Lutibacter sp. Hel_I_33_5]